MLIGWSPTRAQGSTYRPRRLTPGRSQDGRRLSGGNRYRSGVGILLRAAGMFLSLVSRRITADSVARNLPRLTETKRRASGQLPT